MPADVEVVERSSADAFIAFEPAVTDKPTLFAVQDYLKVDGHCVFWSPLHADAYQRRYGKAKHHILPPPMDIQHWTGLRGKANGRTGTMWYGHATPDKGADIVVEWAKRNRIALDVYGHGIGSAPDPDPEVRIMGHLSDEERDLALASHKEFVHFPRYPEPFCYSLMEAWLAGLEVTYAGRIGIESYEQPWTALAERCQNSAEEFWKIAEAVL